MGGEGKVVREGRGRSGVCRQHWMEEIVVEAEKALVSPTWFISVLPPNAPKKKTLGAGALPRGKIAARCTGVVGHPVRRLPAGTWIAVLAYGFHDESAAECAM